MPDVRFVAASRIYPGNAVPAVDALDLEIRDAEFVVLVGPSGSGKTTALRMLAGLEYVDAGAIFIGDRDITDVAPKDRDVAMVFQNYALYPYLTVADNIGFPLRMAKVKRSEREQRVREVAEMLELVDFLERKPGQLSGGQRQRVAMGRAIVRQPHVFLMDEPLSNLDAKLRMQMRADIASLQARLGVTTVYVTHDQSEAMTLGHRVAVLKDGRLQQFDSPHVLYNQPANTFVAGFIGSPSMNLFTSSIVDGSVSLGGVAVAVPGGLDRGRSQIVLGLRPESLEPASDGVPAVVDVVEEIGADTHVFCTAELGGGVTERLVARVATADAPRQGERIHLRPRGDDAHFFDTVGGERLEPHRAPVA
jgi:multiple sugar transport system ATP-binding protein